MWQIAGLPNNVYLFVIWPAITRRRLLLMRLLHRFYTFQLKRCLLKRGMLPTGNTESSDHSHLVIDPEREAKISIEHMNYYHPKGDYAYIKEHQP